MFSNARRVLSQCNTRLRLLTADGMEPVLQAMNEIKRYQSEVILLYTKNKNIGLFVQQVIAEH